VQVLQQTYHDITSYWRCRRLVAW